MTRVAPVKMIKNILTIKSNIFSVTKNLPKRNGGTYTDSIGLFKYSVSSIVNVIYFVVCREICDSMNTFEISRGSVMKQEDKVRNQF